MTFAVAVLTPSTGLCRMAYAQSLAKMIMFFGCEKVFPGDEPQYITPFAVEGSGIAANYEMMVRKFLADEEIRWTHFLSVEDDMAFHPTCLHMLARRNLPIVGANYSTNKGPRQRFTAAYEDGTRCQTRPDSTGTEEVAALPQGFTLVAREVYETLPKPWYLIGWNPETDSYQYQDYYFSQKAREHGYKLFVDHDCSKHVVHVGTKGFGYEDALRDSEELINGR